MTTLTLVYTKIQKIELPTINWRLVCCVGFVVCLVLLVFYVWQVNSLTAGSYLMNSYQKQISELLEENKNLQISFAESSFLGQALEKIQAMNFQKTTSVKYIQIPDNFLACLPARQAKR